MSSSTRMIPPMPTGPRDGPVVRLHPGAAAVLRSGLNGLATALPTDLRTHADIEAYRRSGASRRTTVEEVANRLGLIREERTSSACSVTIFRPVHRDPRAHVVFLHGSGFIAGNRFDGVDVVARHAEPAGADVWTVEYPLAPEHELDEMIDAVLAIVVDCGADGLPTVLAGQSGGGGLAAACAFAARGRGVRLAGQLLTCPMLDRLERPSTGAVRARPGMERSIKSNRVVRGPRGGLHYPAGRARGSGRHGSHICRRGIGGAVP